MQIFAAQHSSMNNIGEGGLFQYLCNKGIPVKGKVTNVLLKKGAQLYGPPQRFTNIYEIISGAVKVGRLSPKGEERIYEILAPGEFFGNLAVLGDDFCEFCKTMSATEVRSYDLPFFKHLITHDPVVAAWFYPKIVYRWNKTETLLAYIRSFEPRERIQLLYTDLRKQIFTADNRLVYLNKLLSYTDMADLTATTRQLVADTMKTADKNMMISSAGMIG
ncbi:Crp/Fnr family transcriptional regulator [Sediminibacterium ginsengisoli]|uniref:cAMP-binding domain of CRP or a regulatory subunit of cAMP-dependent protein kinases n=1 Tax=Sediminibacterium ginsengisoli TaxID=413434 RepID=A0A1T4K9G8_9BACT|nr:Crp/Fnr family transcriptional regulator [Sediminibacterium ginsengisoli]SJZ38955.1 cAMP-binding domain of CRP or a regulatory subunit of cAMP-dependent protein kinases [Sediminibacterium ginsengisoli]